MKCKYYRQLQCQASGKVVAEQFMVINGNHNHPREENDINAMNFKRELRQACVTERGTLKSIYERLSIRNPEGAVVVPFNSVRSSMLRWRQATTPNIPANLEELAIILQTGDWPRFSNCANGAFFSGSVVSDNHRAIIFGNQDFIQNFRASQYVFIDGTFKVVPRRPSFCQILTIFATSMDHAFPIVHIFMERKTKRLYDAVFAYLLTTFPNFVNETVITDYEVALIDSLRASYPQASLRGCFFHFCQAVLRKAKMLGVHRQINDNENGRILLRKYFALPLLPPNMIVRAFESLQDDNAELNDIFRELHVYVRRQWIERITPDHLSVYRQRHRTNNVMESYHRRLNSKLVRHPGVWDLIQILIDIQNTAVIELMQLERNATVFRIARKNIFFNARLNLAWDKLDDGRFSMADFLRHSVHLVERLDRQINEWNGDVQDVLDIEDPVPEPIQPLNLDPILQNPHLLEPNNSPPPLIFFQPQQNVPASPPPLVYFNVDPPVRVPSPILPLPNRPVDPPQDLENVGPPSPPQIVQNRTPPPAFQFPPIPEEIGILFAAFDNEDNFHRIVEHRWEPTMPVTVFDDLSMSPALRCLVCYLNKVQYVMQCGHAFCTTCTATLFNVQVAKCAMCRAELHGEPLLLYL
ncbi:uncharacterized protein LOC115874745 [Sitophilus oryzae]|uniref:Uncharacterized protein LOC115874745 n=1 Tax=Sitophilus oryzae TaxID=7048 RepID=A0A6J2X4E2_SITOR|nr:uncharacterized protein LOC115874745 [Sitophilus oryzae]